MRGVKWMMTLRIAAVILATSVTLVTTRASAQGIDSSAGNPMPPYTDSANLRADASLAAVDFADARVGIACGAHGTVLRTTDGGRRWTVVESGVHCPLEDVLWLSARHVVIVGGSYDPITQISRGVILQSSDAGASWRRGDDEELPRLRRVERQPGGTLTALGDWSHSLLTNRLESHNGGQSWDAATAVTIDPTAASTRERLQHWAQATNMSYGVRDACRVDADILCTVGDHGMIARSTDGGQSWQSVRGGKRGTCVLFVAKNPSTVAWSLIGNESLENRNRTALVLVDSDLENVEIGVARQVMAMLGGASVDPLGAENDASESSRVDAGKSWLQIHRPVVLVIDSQLPSDFQEALLNAATESGVARVVRYSFGQSGSTTVHRDALLTNTGILASDMQLDAMHLVAPDRATASSVTLRYLYDVSAANRRSDSLASALALHKGHRLESPGPPASRRQLQMAQARMQQSRRVERLVTEAMSAERYQQSLNAILDQTAKDDQFRVAWSVWMETIQRNPNRRFQQIVLEQIADRFANRSAGQWAKLRAYAMKHSREWAQLRSPDDERIATSPIQPAAVPVSPFQVSQDGVTQVSATSPLVVPDRKPDRVVTSATAENAPVDLNWEFHPLMLLSREAARRRGDQGTLQPAEVTSADLARLAEAAQQQWSQLVHGDSHAITVRRATHPPRLDGVLDDPCWQSALPRAGSKSELRMAYDDEYLYVGIRWVADEFAVDTSDSGDVMRDQDLTGVDRLRLRLDSDRDLITSMQLQVSASGRTHDAIDNNSHWQPSWYVDTQRSDRDVVVELALSRHDVAELPIPAGEVWYASIERIPAGSTTAQPIIPDPSQWKRIIFQP